MSARGFPVPIYVLIQPGNKSRAALSPADLLTVDLDGNLVRRQDSAAIGNRNPPRRSYRARPEVNVVCHGHPTLSTERGPDRPAVPAHAPLRLQVPRRHRRAPRLHPHIINAGTGRRSRGDPRQRRCLSAPSAHGTVLAADTLQRLFMDCLDLEENAKTLLYARQLGGKISPLTREEAAEIGASYAKSRHRINKMWEHYIHQGTAAGVL